MVSPVKVKGPKGPTSKLTREQKDKLKESIKKLFDQIQKEQDEETKEETDPNVDPPVTIKSLCDEFKAQNVLHEYFR